MVIRGSSHYFVMGLTGFPLEYSLSPRLHSAALHACGLRGEYSLFPVPQLPAGERQILSLLEGLRAGRLDGLNVTIPHKQAIIPYLDDLTALARQVGAVNTVFLTNSRLVGDNTDAPGFIADLRRHLPETPLQRSTLVLGAGGAARAVAHALSAENWRITIAARRPERASELLLTLPPSKYQHTVVVLDKLSQYLSPALGNRAAGDPDGSTPVRNLPDLIINATPVGMHPDSQRSPWPDGLPFPPGAFVYDLVYHPKQTVLVKTARTAGLQAAGGQGMLAEQAMLSFERWTGRRPPIEAMRNEISGRD